MKSVLISIHPKWVEKIASGEKTIEVRKSAPKLGTPFKCYIYCTKAVGHYWSACCCQIREDDLWKNDTGKVEFNDGFEYWGHGVIDKCHRLNGKVVGEFMCDSIYEAIPDYNPITGKFFNYDFFDESGYILNDCLTDEEKAIYANGKPLYGWHISHLKIYDKPNELSEFYQQTCMDDSLCDGCVHHECPIDQYPCNSCNGDRKYLYRPPQSWCYVEQL